MLLSFNQFVNFIYAINLNRDLKTMESLDIISICALVASFISLYYTRRKTRFNEPKLAIFWIKLVESGLKQSRYSEDIVTHFLRISFKNPGSISILVKLQIQIAIYPSYESSPPLDYEDEKAFPIKSDNGNVQIVSVIIPKDSTDWKFGKVLFNGYFIDGKGRKRIVYRSFKGHNNNSDWKPTSRIQNKYTSIFKRKELISQVN